MSLSISVTAGKTLARNERANNAKLNALGLPTLTLSGTASTAQIGDNTVTAAKGSYGPWFYCTDGGTANAHSLTAAASGTTLPTSLVAGQEFAYTAAATNTAAVTVAISGIAGTKALTKQGTTALVAGDVRAGQLVWVRYDGTQFQMASPTGQPRLDRFATTVSVDGLGYVVTNSPTLTALTNGSRILLKWNMTNLGAVTLQVDSVAAKAVRKLGDAALVAGDVVTNQISELVYDSTLDHWLLTSPATQSARTTVAVRQTVLAGFCATTGLPNFLSGTGTTAISFANTTSTTPVCIAFAAGHDSAGSVDYVALIETNAAAWTGLSTNGTYYLYAERNSSTGAITYGQTTTRPTYTNSGTADPASGAHTYLINEGKMYLGNGTTADAKQRVFLGECVVAATVVSSITTYMPRGQYQSGADTAITASAAANQTVTDTHQLGLAPREVRYVLVCQTADLNYAAGDEVDITQLKEVGANVDRYRYSTVLSNVTTAALLLPWVPVSAGGAQIPGLVNKTAYDVTAAITTANWKLRCYAWRGW